jgi:glycosyltransferase involved in cell wall biosynthesis
LKRIPLKSILFKKILPNRIGWKFWLDYQLPSLLKKHKADLLITTGGIASSFAIAQCAWITNGSTSFLSKKNKSYFNFYKRRLKKTFDRSQMIFTCSEKNKQQIIQRHGFDEHSILVVRSFADERYHVLPWTEKENIKVRYAAGKEYYIIVVDSPQQNLIDLLKAFSQFKKRQQSNMQFVFIGEGLKNNPDFIEKLETFKYRSDVHVYDNLSEDDFIKLISGAYGLVHAFNEDETGTIILNAFKANVALITTDEGSLREIAADAALYVSNDQAGSLANQLMLLYKDESLHMQLIEKGKLQWQQFDRAKSMEKLLHAIVQTANKQS